MAGLFNALNAARSSLEVNQKSIEVVGNNISNINTEGYSRQYTQLDPIPSLNYGDFFIGQGVKVTNIQRDHDIFLQAQLEDKYVDFGFASGQTRTLAELERVFNISEENIATDVDRFFDSWQQLSASPADLVLRDTVIQNGQQLAVNLNNIANDLNVVIENINETISSKVEGLNSKITEFAELNDRIYTIEIRGQMANTARDRRDLLVKELSEELGVRAYQENNGMISLQLPGGLPVVQGNMAMRLEAVSSGADITLRLHAGGVARDLGVNTLGGELLGMYTMRDQFIPSIKDTLDRLAYEIGTQVNLQHTAGAGLDSVTGRDFFTDPTVASPPAATVWENAARNLSVAITDAIEIAAAEAPTAPATVAEGDNRNALLMSRIGEQYLIDGMDDFNSYYGRITSRIGIETNQNNLSLGGAQDAVDQLENLREGFVGVSLEEEMISLIQFQRGFESSAKFLSTIDELMETVISLKR